MTKNTKTIDGYVDHTDHEASIFLISSDDSRQWAIVSHIETNEPVIALFDNEHEARIAFHDEIFTSEVPWTQEHQISC